MAKEDYIVRAPKASAKPIKPVKATGSKKGKK